MVSRVIRTSRFGKDEVITNSEYQRKFRLTVEGMVHTAWHNILLRLKKDPDYKNVRLMMTRVEFVEWAIPALEKWIAEHPGEQHSVDRIDAKLHYSLDNIRFLELGENSRRRSFNKNSKAPMGTAWCSGHKKYLPIEFFNKAKTRPPLFVCNYCVDCAGSRYKRISNRKLKERVCRVPSEYT